MKPLKVNFERALEYFQRGICASNFHRHASFLLYKLKRVYDLNDSSASDSDGYEYRLHPYKLYDMPHGAIRHEYYLSDDEYNAIQKYLADSDVSSITINLAHVKTN